MGHAAGIIMSAGRGEKKVATLYTSGPMLEVGHQGNPQVANRNIFKAGLSTARKGKLCTFDFIILFSDHHPVV